LTLIEVPTVNVGADHEGNRIGAFEFPESRVHPGRLARPIAVSTIENSALVHDDWLVEAVRSDVVDETVEVSAVQERKQLSKRMKR
jgi:hypothetical protein